MQIKVPHPLYLQGLWHFFNLSTVKDEIIKDFSFRDNRNMLKWEKRLEAGKLITGMKIYEGTI